MDQQRLDRALNQRMFLIEFTLDQTTKRPIFMVKGSNKNVYKVYLASIPTCSCIDYKKRKQPCKHVYFVLFRILKAKMNDVERSLLFSGDINEKYIDKLYEEFLKTDQRHNGSILDQNRCKLYQKLIQDTKDEEIFIKDHRRPLEGDCSICYEDLSSASHQTVTTCQFCWNNFHTTCIKQWKDTGHDTCPLCRQTFVSPSCNKYEYERRISEIFNGI